VRAHRIFRALILASGSPAEFLMRWDPFDEPASLEVLDEAYAGAPDLAELRRLYRDFAAESRTYFRRVSGRRAADGAPASWLADPEAYRTVRAMFAADRVRIVAGDLLGEMPGRIAAAHTALGEPIRVVYLSNAEQYFAYDDSFRAAFAAMPFDGRSLILRTVSRPLPDGSRHTWHWQVEPAFHFRDLLASGVARFADVEERAMYEPDGGLSRFGIAAPP
jgi:hypothetical protein